MKYTYNDLITIISERFSNSNDLFLVKRIINYMMNDELVMTGIYQKTDMIAPEWIVKFCGIE